ncbi:ATP synthase subunit s, mitochondrial-like [Anneissia japonica]|uniref:ATP synthase subunit s, mitochondrial-like n=1 Tax=Anneissia japonica TaxID=1529436 RepID=UPI00142595D1|nr:ATP synthase subunit s, mitochondrial-like [Anneissia japonica]XP_033104945.1 ATP synthase subunit s, mitochondrial-like [Anneissia japonica]XP_033104946.1 ATP synthase subunit s, mitochondrial-like [Anneissia japonica]
MAKKCLLSVAQLSCRLSAPYHGLLTTLTQQRGLWGMLNAIFNKFDQNRVDEVGPDRAAAEWLLRCGAAVKFNGYEKWNDDYNTLPMGAKDRYRIEAVDATDSSIMHLGFEYFRGLEKMRRLKLHHATYITDESMHKLEILKDSLQDLQVSSCGDVSDKGLISLHKLSKLRYLFLCDLPAVKNMDTVLSTLRIALPNCEVRYLSLEGRKDLRKELSKDRELLRYIEESTAK